MKETNLADKLRLEQQQTMERGFKIEERKILFVISLFGIGGINVVGSDVHAEFRHVWYLAPFIAVFFDMLASLQKFSVRRIGAFLRNCSNDKLEREWEGFVGKNRDNVLCWESDGFTVLTFCASSWMIFKYIHGSKIVDIHQVEWLWMLTLLVFHFHFRMNVFKKLKKMDKEKWKCSSSDVDNTELM